MAPQISVLISTYNNRRFVAKKLAEIQRQTIFDRAEFIFIETGSPERERELIAPFCAEHPNCRLLTTEDRRTLGERREGCRTKLRRARARVQAHIRKRFPPGKPWLDGGPAHANLRRLRTNDERPSQTAVS